MFELGDIVRFRHWSNKPWEEGIWFIFHVELTWFYDDEFYLYGIEHTETGEIQTEVNWQQIEAI